MIRRPPRSTRTDTLFPYTTLFRSDRRAALGVERDIAFPEQDGTKILAGQARQVAATAAAGFERLAAIMAFPHHRSEEHTSELQSLMRISYAALCFKKKQTN